MYYIQYIKYIKKWVEYIKLSLLTHILCGEYYGLAKYFTSVQYLRREHIRVEFLPSWSSCLSACYKKSRAVATCVRRRRSARVGRGTARRRRRNAARIHQGTDAAQRDGRVRRSRSYFLDANVRNTWQSGNALSVVLQVAPDFAPLPRPAGTSPT